MIDLLFLTNFIFTWEGHDFSRAAQRLSDLGFSP